MGTASLKGRIALVTGASRGIGRAVAVHLASLGARTVLAARSAEAIAALADELGEGHVPIAMDVTDRAKLSTALDEVRQRVGTVDILVANAGIAESAPYDRTEDDAWERMMAVNATAVFRMCRELVPPMVAAGWGRVIIVASNAGLTGYAYSSAYCASKHAVVGFMRSMALEIARTPVTVNALCPGWVATQMSHDAVTRIADKTGTTVAKAQQALENMSPQGRMIEPEEVAYAAGALCHDNARGIHGQTLLIDGGQLLK